MATLGWFQLSRIHRGYSSASSSASACPTAVRSLQMKNSFWMSRPGFVGDVEPACRAPGRCRSGSCSSASAWESPPAACAPRPRPRAGCRTGILEEAVQRDVGAAQEVDACRSGTPAWWRCRSGTRACRSASSSESPPVRGLEHVKERVLGRPQRGAGQCIVCVTRSSTSPAASRTLRLGGRPRAPPFQVLTA